MKNILVTAIGFNPQIVTETYQKLIYEVKQIDEIVTFYTTAEKVKEGIRTLQEKLKEEKVKFTPISLEFNEVNGLEENEKFLKVVFSELWRRRLQDQSIYISIAGGRKTMSAMMYWIGQVIGAKNITHVLTSQEIEKSHEYYPPAEKLNLVHLDAIDLFPTVLHLCNVNNVDKNKPESVLEIVRRLPEVLPGLITNAVTDIYPTDHEEIEFDDLKQIKEDLIKKITTDSKAHILIFGETGVGKEYIVRFINKISPSKMRPLVTINCSSLTPQLAASELFGHKRGAFTGATEEKQGKIELAKDGDLFLDEVGDLSPEVQPQLLRFIQFGEYTRLGENETRKINVRVIAATNKPLSNLRRDFFERFKIKCTIPPLRERPNDLRKFVQYKLKIRHKIINKVTMNLLLNYNWPGNFRQLDSVLFNAIAIDSDSGEISFDLIKEKIVESRLDYPSNGLPEEANEKEKIIKVLTETKGKGQIKKAAARLGMASATLYYKLKQYRIDTSKYK